MRLEWIGFDAFGWEVASSLGRGSEARTLALSLAEAARGSVDDDGAPFHLLALLPVGVADPRERSLGGTARHCAFAAFSLPDASFAGPAGQRRMFAELLLHEMFHDWNGRAPRRVALSELCWLCEGFKLLHRAAHRAARRLDRRRRPRRRPRPRVARARRRPGA